MFLLVACSSPTRDPPAFKYKLIHYSAGIPETLLNLDFVNYDAGLASGPHTVTVRENGMSRDITMEVGYCDEVATCAGPLRLEQLELGIEGTIKSYFCDGLDGSLRVGIDADETGACMR